MVAAHEPKSMKKTAFMMKLRSHPRLYIDAQAFTRLQRQPKSLFLKIAQDEIEKNAAHWVQMPPLTFNPDVHNAFLGRAREVQVRVLTLLAVWQQTHDDRIREAVLRYIRMIGEWECWSWIAWRKGDYRPTAIYDLSYGENSMTLALAYDLLFDTLSAAEKRMFQKIATQWSFASGAVHAKPGGAWWFGKADSNWNTVCAGGLGMLCLALYDDVPEARERLPLVEQSIQPFMRSLDQTSGAWPEGIGYWNYGMGFAFVYLLSWENSTGRPHPLMQLKGTRKTLEFPLDFCPYGQGCSFGDANHWAPLPIHYAVARRLRVRSVRQGIDARLREDPKTLCRGGWASAAGWRWFHDDVLETRHPPKHRGAKLYKGLDWAVLADQYPEPTVFMSLRGGTTQVPHGHCDLFSFNLVIRGEKLIANEGNAEYLDTTFSPRRYDLPDINAQYKNTILINGVGVPYGAALDTTEIFNRPEVSGVRLIGTAAMGLTRGQQEAANFCGRLVLLLKDRVFLIIDRVATRHPARIESRLHTHARVRRYLQGAGLYGQRETLRLAFAANVPGRLAWATTAPTTPSVEPAQMLRWCTQTLHQHVILVTLAVPGSGSARVSVKPAGPRWTIAVQAQPWTMTFDLSEDLKVHHVR